MINNLKLTKKLVLDFLPKHKLMTIGTSGDFPWIATVYYTFDQDLNLYFLSNPTTLHVKQILKNPKVAVAISDSSQDIGNPKNGLQLFGIAQQISGIYKVKYAFDIWKNNLGVINPKLTYQAVKSSMFKVTPKRIKLFDQQIFKVKDGQEPILNL
jgi:uncharacterized protein YhbP (UPF0306 family)